MKCDYCDREAVESFQIEEPKRGKAFRDEEGKSMGREVLSPAIYAHGCLEHRDRIATAIRESELAREEKRKAAARKAAITRKYRKAQERLV